MPPAVPCKVRPDAHTLTAAPACHHVAPGCVGPALLLHPTYKLWVLSPLPVTAIAAPLQVVLSSDEEVFGGWKNVTKVSRVTGYTFVLRGCNVCAGPPARVGCA